MEESQKLLEEAYAWLEKSKVETDIRQRAEKAHLAATLAADALIVHRGYPKPPSLYRRKELLLDIDPELRLQYSSFVEDLHRTCFYDGVCPLPLVEENIKRVEGFINRVREVIGNK
jgi:hypothetical protein